MSFDTWTVSAVAQQLRETIVPGRVQQVIQADNTSFAFEVYAQRRRFYLLVSANQQAPRVHLLSDKPRRGVDTASPLLQLMRKFVRDSLLVAVEQPAWERLLVLRFEHPELGHTQVVAELIGRWTNVLLLREATAKRGEGNGKDAAWRILECVHRYRLQDGASRAAMPGQLYHPPPAQAGLAPDTMTASLLSETLQAAPTDAPLWRVLVDNLLGLSPQVAREIVYRGQGDSAAVTRELTQVPPLLNAIASLVDPILHGGWQPCVARDLAGMPVAFAPYPLTHRRDAHLEPVDTISLAAERFYDERTHSVRDAYTGARRQVAASLDRVAKLLHRRQEAMQRELRTPAEIDRLRASGEWILALATQIAPRQAELRLPEGVAFDTIALDPQLSPADNAAAYFKRYRKAKRGLEMTRDRLAAVAAEQAYVDQLATDLALAADRNEIDAVRLALSDAGYLRQPTHARVDQSKGLRRFTSCDGMPILVGRNSRQNDQITFEIAAADDLWLHARGLPGAHVVIRSGGQPVSDQAIRQAAGLAAFYSKGRGDTWVDVLVVERRRVRRAPGGRPGMVLVEGERVVRVQPQDEL
jgi:predicted ribosome quality control (RQC) complex YloA/Tae2 family protein